MCSDINSLKEKLKYTLNLDKYSTRAYNFKFLFGKQISSVKMKNFRKIRIEKEKSHQASFLDLKLPESRGNNLSEKVILEKRVYLDHILLRHTLAKFFRLYEILQKCKKLHELQVKTFLKHVKTKEVPLHFKRHLFPNFDLDRNFLLKVDKDYFYLRNLLKDELKG